MLQVLTPIQEARMVVDAHPYMVNALAVCTATAEASAQQSAPMSELMRRCLEDESPPACCPLPPDSTFRALFNGEIRMHQGGSPALTYSSVFNVQDCRAALQAQGIHTACALRKQLLNQPGVTWGLCMMHGHPQGRICASAPLT